MTEPDWIDVACPQCGAKAGQDCVLPLDRRATTHKRRLSAAAKPTPKRDGS